MVDELAASIGENGVDVGELFVATVGDRFVDERPQTFGRLELWCVGRQKDETHAGRNCESCFAMPSGIVEDENDAALFFRADGLGEVGQQFFEERLADAVGQIPDRLAARRLDEGGDIEPLIAMMAERQRPLFDGRPDAAADRLQPEAMLVGRPDLDGLARMLPRFFGGDFRELFLKASSSSAVAAFGFLGRGAWIDQRSFFKASQPRGACTCASPRRDAIQSATLGPLHWPPPSGGAPRRSRKASRSSSDRSGRAPRLPRRRSPSAPAPCRA